MTDTLTIVGKVATEPSIGRTTNGTSVTNFRLASTPRRLDPATNTWVDGETNWFSVAAFRQLAEHVRGSLHTGDSVIVTGRLKIRNWEANGRQGTSVDIEADAIGHDLRWGTSSYMPRSRVLASARAFEEGGSASERESAAPPVDSDGEATDEPDEGTDALEDIDLGWADDEIEQRDAVRA
ncbi:single-stranded DNA-binding protein [Microbacterium sp.]|uniref:single-stranded DNA-binding protein n=1 Tax=Microbacterium sp. TaxID=51671 RepID=UPI0039E6A788